MTVIIPNCPEKDQEVITGLIQERGSSYSVQGLALQELISPLFIEGFVKRGETLTLPTAIYKLIEFANCD